MSEHSLKEGEDFALELHLKGHKKAVTSLSFHSDSKHFASASEDNSIIVWNVEQNQRSYNFQGHTDVVNCVEYAPNGALLGSCSQDQTVRLWVPTITGGCTQFRAHPCPIRTMSFSPDSKTLVTGGNDKALKLWNVSKKQFLHSFTGHNNWIRDVEFASDGDTLVSCSDDKTIRVWDVRTAETNQNIACSSKAGSPSCLSLHRNGYSLAVAVSSGSVRIYDFRTGKLQQHYSLFTETTGVSWHPLSSSYLLSCGQDGNIIVVDVMEGRPTYTIRGHEGAIRCIQFSSSGEQFASGGADGRILVWKSNLERISNN